MDTAVSGLTSKLSSFQLDDCPLETDTTSYQYSKPIAPRRGSRTTTLYDTSLLSDYSDFSTSSKCSPRHRKVAAPLQARLKSLNLNTTAEFASRIPKMSPSVSSSSFREGNEENTPSRVPYTPHKLFDLSMSSSMSHLPVPTKKLLHSAKKTRDRSKLSGSRKRYSMQPELQYDAEKALSTSHRHHQHHHHHHLTDADPSNTSIASSRLSVSSSTRHHLPPPTTRKMSYRYMYKREDGGDQLDHHRSHRSLQNNFTSDSFSPRVAVPIKKYPTRRSNIRSVVHHHRYSMPVFGNGDDTDDSSSSYVGMHMRYSNREPVEKKVKISDRYSRKHTSIEITRERRLAAIKEANEHLNYSKQEQKKRLAMKEAEERKRKLRMKQLQQKRLKLKQLKQQSLVEHEQVVIHRDNRIHTFDGLLMLIKQSKRLMRLFGIYMKATHGKFTPDPGCISRDLAMKRPEMYRKLNVYEKGEVMDEEKVYFAGQNRSLKPKVDRKNFKTNFGFDDSGKNYKAMKGDQIRFRYEICEQMGKGTFGSVLVVKDHKIGRVVAVKIIKNDMEWSLQAVNEVKFMKELSSLHCQNNIMYYDHFHFRSHMCIVQELLSVNLFQVIEATNFKGLGLPLVKVFAKDILKGLQAIHKAGMIHCDMKPENLMLGYDEAAKRFVVKIIDFGSSCRIGHLAYSYLQSRFYRAPEVCIGARYNEKIDIWSFGAIVVELFVGMPIFQTQDEYSLLNEFLSYFGPPPKEYIMQLRRELEEKGPISGWDGLQRKIDKIDYRALLWSAFTKDGFVDVNYLIKKSPRHKFRGSTKTVRQFLLRHANVSPQDAKRLLEVGEFSNFVERCFSWNRDLRAECDELLEHHFLVS